MAGGWSLKPSEWYGYYLHQSINTTVTLCSGKHEEKLLAFASSKHAVQHRDNTTIFLLKLPIHYNVTSKRKVINRILTLKLVKFRR